MSTNKKLTIKKAGTKGFGVFANVAFEIGDLVVCGKPVSVAKVRTNTSFQVDFDKHVELDAPARIINHSCDPNLGVRNNHYGGYDFVAIKKIKPGDELGWDYCTTEYISIAIREKCLCGSNLCRIKISGYCNLLEEVRETYNGFIADYLKREQSYSKW